MESVPVAQRRLDQAVYSPALCCWPRSECPLQQNSTLLLEGETGTIVRSTAGKQFGVMRAVSCLVWNLLSLWVKIKC